VALDQPYNETADVYSFCVLLWQILKLETPYEGYSMNMFARKVVRGGVRPKVSDQWHPDLQAIMKKGWGPAKDRPPMESISECLREEIGRNSDEEIDEVMDASRKSEMSLRLGERSKLSI